MALLQVRDCPDDLYKRLGQAAENDRRSIAQETVVLLRDVLNVAESARARRRVALAEASKLVESTPNVMADSVIFIREDRER
jgi:plasmid stability protein